MDGKYANILGFIAFVIFIFVVFQVIDEVEEKKRMDWSGSEHIETPTGFW